MNKINFLKIRVLLNWEWIIGVDNIAFDIQISVYLQFSFTPSYPCLSLLIFKIINDTSLFSWSISEKDKIWLHQNNIHVI
jgi:hypothetical protein